MALDEWQHHQGRSSQLDLEWMKRVARSAASRTSMPRSSLPRLSTSTTGDLYMTPGVEGGLPLTRQDSRTSSVLKWPLRRRRAGAETGGPWVKPEHAMKKLVWSETRIPGGQKFTGTLPKPPLHHRAFSGSSSSGRHSDSRIGERALAGGITARSRRDCLPCARCPRRQPVNHRLVTHHCGTD